MKNILSKLEIYEKDRCKSTQDFIAIQNYVIDQLKENDVTFRKAYDGLILDGEKSLENALNLLPIILILNNLFRIRKLFGARKACNSRLI